MSIGGSRLIGPLSAMNNKGIVLSRLADDDEIKMLRRETGLNVDRLNFKVHFGGQSDFLE